MLSQTAEQEKRLNDTIKLQQATSGQALLRAKEREKELEQALAGFVIDERVPRG